MGYGGGDDVRRERKERRAGWRKRMGRGMERRESEIREEGRKQSRYRKTEKKF